MGAAKAASEVESISDTLVVQKGFNPNSDRLVVLDGRDINPNKRTRIVL